MQLKGTETMEATETQLRTELVETCRAMDRTGLTRGTSGNVSVRLRDGFLISPTGIPYDELTPGMVVRMDMDGSSHGAAQPSSEWRIHRDVLSHRPDLAAVVHTHSTHATAVAILGLSIPAIHYGVAAAGGADIRCAPYALFGTQALSDGVQQALKGRRACLMAHHGVVACQKDLKRALNLAVTVEELARLYLLCRGLMDPPVLGADEIDEVLERYKTYGQ